MNNQHTALQCNRWLKMQGALLRFATKGSLVLSSQSKDNGEHQNVGYHWPENTGEHPELIRICSRAQREGKGVLLSFVEERNRNKQNQYAHLAYPLVINKQLSLTAAFEIHQKDKQQLHLAMVQLECGLRFLAEEFTTADSQISDKDTSLHTLLSIVEGIQRCPTYKDAAQKLTDSLAVVSSCHRLSLGRYKDNKVQIDTISNQSNIDKNSSLVQALIHAMEECIDQGCEVQFPQEIGHLGPINVLHKNLVTDHGSSFVFSLPIGEMNLENPFVLLFEYNSTNGSPQRSLQLLRDSAKLVGPLLLGKQQQEYGFIQFLSLKAKVLRKKYTNNRRRAQLKALAMLSLLLFCFFAQGDFKIPADVSLSGTILRGITAPFPGYIAEAHKSAGDRVKVGEPLAQLDTSDLTLEELTWSSKLSQANLEYRKAVAENATSTSKIIDQQKKQAEIQLSLLRLQKKRAVIKAPFTGVIITGDLSQSVGGPVERGKLLFQMVPDNGYKIIAQVNEKDISFVENDQKATLIFNSLPREKFHFTVSKVTPVSTAANGQNSFRVEGILSDTSKRLRPGMKGYAKITVGSEPLIWLWTRSLRDRLRLLGWSMLP